MEKLKKIFSGISNLVKATFKEFPITMVIIYVTTLICTFGTDEFLDKFIGDYWIIAMGLGALGTLLTEQTFKNKIKKGIGIVVSLLIAFVIRIVLDEPGVSIYDMKAKMVLTYIFSLPLITLYKIIKDSGLKLKEYVLRVLANVGKVTTTYLLGNIGIVIVLLVFIELILDGNDYDIMPRTLILLFGGYYIPALVNSFTDVKKEAGKFIKILLTGILMPVAVFLIGILYLYIFKTIINGEILKQSLFFILSLTFSLAIPCSILLANYSENKTVLKMSNIIFYSFIPLLILQIVSMNVRVGDYGLTEARYMGYLLIAYEIILITLRIIKNEKYLTEAILVMVGFIVLAILSPLNVFDVSVYSQTARITNMLEKVDSFKDLSVDEKNECKRAYLYVKNSEKSEYLSEKLSKEEETDIRNYKIVYKDEDGIEREEHSYDYVAIYDDDSAVNIEGFKTLHPVEYSCYDRTTFKLEEIDFMTSKIKAKVYIADFIKEMIEAEENKDEKSVFEEIRYLKTDKENVVFLVTGFTFSYETTSLELDSFRIDGYLLEK